MSAARRVLHHILRLRPVAPAPRITVVRPAVFVDVEHAARLRIGRLCQIPRLLLRSLHALTRVDLGFRPEGVLTLRVSLPTVGYEEPEKVAALYTRLLAEASGPLKSPEAGDLGDAHEDLMVVVSVARNIEGVRTMIGATA